MKIPVVAIGGVTDLADVLDFLAVGAVAVQVGTAIFADPTLPVRLVDELEAECGAPGVASYRDLIGTALPKTAGRAVRRRVSNTGRSSRKRHAHGMVCACSVNAPRSSSRRSNSHA